MTLRTPDQLGGGAVDEVGRPATTSMREMRSSRILEVVKAACAAPSADNSQPWQLYWDGRALRVSYRSPGHGISPFGRDSPATLLAIGALVENVASTARLVDLPLDVQLSPGSDGPYLVATATGDPFATSDAREWPALVRHTNRLPYESRPLPAALAGALEAASEGRARCALYAGAADLRRLAQLVAAASRIRFQTREVHEWLGASLRFSAAEVASGDGLDVRGLDLPPGGQALLRLVADWRRMRALNRFGAYRAMAAIEAVPIRRGPAVLAVIAPPDGPGSLDAGRLMARQWTWLNREGFAVQPYYVVSDQLERLAEGRVPPELAEQAARLQDDCGRLVGLGPAETLHMLLRVGYPKREPVRARRLPLAHVVTDPTGALFP